MLIEILLFLFLGILIGIFTGLFPGIHINLVGAMLISLSTTILLKIPAIYLAIFIISLAITHTFLDFIPSILLGCPDEGTELSILPGHSMLKEGKGFQAIYNSSLGCLYGIFILIMISIPVYFLINFSYEFLKKFVPFLLILVCLILIFTDEKKISALFAFALSGIWGLLVLNLDFKEPLLPMLSGLFGASTLILSIKSKTKIQEQKSEEKKSFKKTKSIFAAIITSPISIFLPAVGSGQIAVIGNQIARTEREGFLFLLGITNILAMSFSFLALFAIAKTRTGAAVAIKELIGIPSWKIMFLFLFVILISGTISFFLSKFLAKKFTKLIERFNYSKISIFILILISILVLIFSGLFGFLILIVSTFTGIYCISLNVRRTQMMGCLLLPTIFLYFF